MSGSNSYRAEDVETILRGFEEGVFVRDISRDIETGWALRLLPYLAALGRLSEVKKERDATHDSSREKS